MTKVIKFIIMIHFVIAMIVYTTAAYCHEDTLIKKIKTIQLIDKLNPKKSNVFRNIKRKTLLKSLISELNDYKKIDLFLSKALNEKLSLVSLPDLTKYIENKIKSDTISGKLPVERSSEMINILRTLKSSSRHRVGVIINDPLTRTRFDGRIEDTV